MLCAVAKVLLIPNTLSSKQETHLAFVWLGASVLAHSARRLASRPSTDSLLLESAALVDLLLVEVPAGAFADASIVEVSTIIRGSLPCTDASAGSESLCLFDGLSSSSSEAEASESVGSTPKQSENSSRTWVFFSPAPNDVTFNATM